MAFEKFTLIRRSYKPRASIRSNGQIGLSKGAVTRYKLEGYNYCVLFYDKELKKIGIKFTQDKVEEGTLKLKIKQGNGAISAKSFLEYYQINYKEGKGFDAEWDDVEKMLVFQI